MQGDASEALHSHNKSVTFLVRQETTGRHTKHLSPHFFKRSYPVALQSFYRLESLSDDEDSGTVTSSVMRSQPYYPENTLSITTDQLSSWHPDWGPGRRLRTRRRRMRIGGSRSELWTQRTRPHGGFIEAIRTFRRVSKPLRAEKIRALVKASKAIGTLQEAASDPYPPVNLPAIDTHSSAGKLILEELRFFFGVCLSVYPTGHVTKHYGIKLQARSMPESVREFLSGTIRSDTDDIVIVDYLEKSEVHRPAYCLVVDHARRLILLILRGSVQFSDVATDVQCEIVQETRTHDGMERAAGWFDIHLRPITTFLCTTHPTYDVRLCGHSLGGGVASLLTMKWLNITAIAGPAPVRPKLRAYSYGAPAICTSSIATNFKQHIWSVTNGRDIISRLSYGSVRNMTKLLLAVCEQSKQAGDPRVQRQVRQATREANQDTVGIFSIDNLMAAVADVSEKVETVFRNAEETMSRLGEEMMNMRHPFTHNPLGVPMMRQMSARRDTTIPEEPGEVSRAESPESSITAEAYSSEVPELAADQSPGNSSRGEPMASKFARYATNMKDDVSAWMQKQFGPGGIRREREPLLTLLNKMRDLFEEDDQTILTPAGRWFMTIPAAHFVIAGRPPPVHLMPGGFALFDASNHGVELCKEMIFRKRAVHDHYPQFIGFSIGSDLSLALPEEVAQEMERALGVMGLDFQVRPCWRLPNILNLRYRNLKQKQMGWVPEEDNPSTLTAVRYLPLLTELSSIRRTIIQDQTSAVRSPMTLMPGGPFLPPPPQLHSCENKQRNLEQRSSEQRNLEQRNLEQQSIVESPKVITGLESLEKSLTPQDTKGISAASTNTSSKAGTSKQHVSSLRSSGCFGWWSRSTVTA
eukprot:Blabericola_migrator_1__1844@NODE_14_length_24048_cov_80_277428_g11_i0_p5_GENE_NODE_14_length_24048_cov_80_277428_g11_i0NODE_14_length_24048_cov_80_277428_g11_i0_p5_ORF_typecomplete_len866_score107_95Lipase_3/PF01764_25/1_2e04Lipase_3/PF01764_25/3_2e22DUF2974/PF11187_8/0_0039UPF0147/PF03685_13/0_77UPF0147/PF03685_13/97Hydrolase_4/PF12146_8/7_2e03Hydrolase_4/PF12146_8/0_078Chlorophyllase2/PF12740_7/0_11Chlorophyllase2/PF12740_7/3_3e03Chlorophyllase/PF07224_11/0_24_NODE_14_length_24048_cov_80_2774